MITNGTIDSKSSFASQNGAKNAPTNGDTLDDDVTSFPPPALDDDDDDEKWKNKCANSFA